MTLLKHNIGDHWGIIGNHWGPRVVNCCNTLCWIRENRKDGKAKGRSPNEKFFEVVARNDCTLEL